MQGGLAPPTIQVNDGFRNLVADDFQIAVGRRRGGAEEMAGGETEAVRQLESSVTVSSVFCSARKAISAHNQTAVIASPQPQIIFSSLARSCALMKRSSAMIVPTSQSPGNFAQAYLLTAIAHQDARRLNVAFLFRGLTSGQSRHVLPVETSCRVAPLERMNVAPGYASLPARSLGRTH